MCVLCLSKSFAIIKIYQKYFCFLINRIREKCPENSFMFLKLYGKFYVFKKNLFFDYPSASEFSQLPVVNFYTILNFKAS